MQEKITLACITQDRIENIKRLLNRCIDYVDRVIIVDSFSVDGTREWAENFSPKVLVVQRQWDDSFARQYNEYLKYVEDGWVLILDDDEYPSKALLKSLPEVIEKSNNYRNYGIVEYRCNPIDIDNNGIIIGDNGPVNYYRQLFYKYEVGMRYIIDLHQSLIGHKNRNVVKREEVYYHIKSEQDMYRNAIRNWWIDGVWMTGASSGFRPPEWYELRDVVLEAYPDVKVFGDWNSIMLIGNMDKRIKDHLYKIKDIKDEHPNRLFNELRATWRYYFEMLHPEEKIEYEKNLS